MNHGPSAGKVDEARFGVGVDVDAHGKLCCVLTARRLAVVINNARDLVEHVNPWGWV